MRAGYDWRKAERNERYKRARSERVIVCNHTHGKGVDAVTGIVRCKVCSKVIGRVSAL